MNRRPQLILQGSSASPAEAAAVMAAVEQFMRDHAPVAAPPAPATNAWLRAARLEAVDRGAAGHWPWGDPHPWG